MSIPKSFVVDISGRGEVLRFESVLRELKRVEKKNGEKTLMKSCHVIHYVTTIIYLFIVQEIKETKKEKEKSN